MHFVLNLSQAYWKQHLMPCPFIPIDGHPWFLQVPGDPNNVYLFWRFQGEHCCLNTWYVSYTGKKNSLRFFPTSHNNSSNCYFGSDFLWPKLFFNQKKLFDPKSSSTEISSVEVYAQLVVSWVCRNETATLAPVFRLEPWTLGWKRCSWS